jgi:DNA replication and repair protein RecF
MAIVSLRVVDFRNLSVAELTPCHRGLNIIHGLNGSGKTSLLEAIHYIGLGRSFRSGTSHQLIRHQTDKFILFAQIINDAERHIPIGVERHTNGSTRLRVSEKDTMTMTELATLLPIRVINSHSHHLFESGPIYRRKFLDWGLFYQFEEFLPCWRNFERALRQRNILLRERRPLTQLKSWTEELVKYGVKLDNLRRQYVELFTPFLIEAGRALLAMADLQVSYHPGWDNNYDYASVLADYSQEEYRFGHTQFGPHRADLEVDIGAVSVKHFLSRGQQKLLVCAMILAQGMMLARHTNKEVIYLVDDLPSELDRCSRKKLISLLAQQRTQVFITAIESETICELIEMQLELPTKVFHVEHGYVEGSSF